MAQIIGIVMTVVGFGLGVSTYAGLKNDPYTGFPALVMLFVSNHQVSAAICSIGVCVVMILIGLMLAVFGGKNKI
ncbi:hypothetical protein HGA91_01645 [candidate division WWE3 bacterium]|nr:hypothetical protein [candidate division WWE3 bacterium]